MQREEVMRIIEEARTRYHDIIKFVIAAFIRIATTIGEHTVHREISEERWNLFLGVIRAEPMLVYALKRAEAGGNDQDVVLDAGQLLQVCAFVEEGFLFILNNYADTSVSFKRLHPYEQFVDMVASASARCGMLAEEFSGIDNAVVTKKCARGLIAQIRIVRCGVLTEVQWGAYAAEMSPALDVLHEYIYTW